MALGLCWVAGSCTRLAIGGFSCRLLASSYAPFDLLLAQRIANTSTALQIRRTMAATSASGQQERKGVVALGEVKRFIVDSMKAVGTPPQHCALAADILVAADYRGHFSHGLNRLEMYMKEIQSKQCDAAIKPEVVKESPSTAWVDGKNGLGFVVGDFCMKLAINKAKETGVGWVVAKSSNHYGIAGWYPMMATKEGMIGMSFTNTSPFLVPTRAKKPMLGTNPLSVAAPGKDGDDFVLDMATTAVAVGKMELKRRAGAKLPSGWAVDELGRETDDAGRGIDKGGLMPLGGPETSSGFKGYGLAAVVELFCGVLGGASFGPHVRKWGVTHEVANLGQCFVAFDPECFAPGFQERLGQFMGDLRDAEPVLEDSPVLVAGDPERAHGKMVDQLGGIPYHHTLITAMAKLAEEWKLQPMKELK